MYFLELADICELNTLGLPAVDNTPLFWITKGKKWDSKKLFISEDLLSLLTVF